MSERKRAKQAWDEKMKTHQGDREHEAFYLEATGGYDKALPGSTNIHHEGKASWFNGRKREKHAGVALAAIAIAFTPHAAPASAEGHEVPPATNQIIEAESHIGTLAIQAIEDNSAEYEHQVAADMVASVLVADQTIVIMNA